MKTITLIVILISLSASIAAQPRKQSNWLNDKRQLESRWRLGLGYNVMEPIGINCQLYKVSSICTQGIAIRKKLSVDFNFFKEGILFESIIKNLNADWEKGGVRFGLDFKYYMPWSLNPYLGIGIEAGTRGFDDSVEFYPDAVGRVGVEFKIIGRRLSPSSRFHANMFAEAKYNHCVTINFSYLLPSLGLRFHIL